ncbi:MAG: tetratricopeptide repeat protein [Candidatus Lernaella stagnicola]|nr:tetratricopeptide repeat protein [Candidatus Lernaella stagnicola]
MSDAHELKFVGEQHREAVTRILRFLDTADPVFLLTGEPGMGKSRVLHELLKQPLFQDSDARFLIRFEIFPGYAINSLLTDWAKSLFHKEAGFWGTKDRWRKFLGALPEIGKLAEQLIKDELLEPRDRLIRLLQAVSAAMDDSKRVLIVIDPWEDLSGSDNTDLLVQLAAQRIPGIKFLIAQRNDDVLALDAAFRRLARRHTFAVERLADSAAEETFETNEALARIPESRRAEFLEKLRGWPLALAAYADMLADRDRDVNDILDALPPGLEMEIRSLYWGLRSEASQAIETLCLVGATVDAETWAGLLGVTTEKIAEIAQVPNVAKLIESADTEQGRQFRMRYALYTEWICRELRQISRESVNERYMEFYRFFRKRFGDCRDRVDDLMRAIECLDRLDNPAYFLSETENDLQRLYTLSAFDALLELIARRDAYTNLIGSIRLVSATPTQIACMNKSRGELPKAREFYERGLQISCDVFDRVGEVLTLNNIADVHRLLGEMPKALEPLEESLQIRREVADRGGEAEMLADTDRDVNDILDALPPDLETEIRRLYGGLRDDARQAIETLCLLDATVDVETWARLLGLAPENIAEIVRVPNVAKLIKSANTEQGRQFRMRHALYTEWICHELRQISRESVNKRYEEFYRFFRERFGDRRDRVDDLMRAIEYLDRMGNVQVFLDETDGVSEQLYTWSLYDAMLELETKRVAKANSIGDRRLQGELLNNVAGVFWARGDMTKALALFEESLQIDRELGDRAGEGASLSNIAGVHQARGDLKKALELYEESLRIDRELGDRAGEGTTLNNIGEVYRVRGDLTKALEFYEQSLQRSREMGDRVGEGTTLNNIGGVFWARGDLTKALESYEESLQISRDVGNRAGEGATLNNIAMMHEARGDLTKALESYEESLQIFRELGDRAGVGTTLNNLAGVHKARGDLAEALEYFEQSLQITREVGDRAGEAITLHNMAKVFESQNDFEKALEYSRMACAIFKEIDHHHQEYPEKYLASLIAKMKA